MKVKELITPVSEYKTLTKDATLSDAATTLRDSKHRDILVVNENDAFIGVLTMVDILMAFEPNYKKLNRKDLDTDILSNRFVADIFKEFDLWSNPLEDLCKKGLDIKVGDAMYTPADEEYLDINADLENGVHQYIVGGHQPIIVRDNGNVAGILRLNDVFEELIKRMNACACES